MGRPPAPLLSTDQIAAAAMELVDATGRFTMPELARRLQVRPSSLYNHVTGRDQIVELLRERAMSEVQLPDEQPERPWTEVVAEVLRSYRRSYARYPRLIPLLSVYPVNSSHAIRMYNVLAVTLRRAGFDAADTLRAITLMDCFVLGLLWTWPRRRRRGIPVRRSARSSPRRWPPVSGTRIAPTTLSNTGSR